MFRQGVMILPGQRRGDEGVLRGFQSCWGASAVGTPPNLTNMEPGGPNATPCGIGGVSDTPRPAAFPPQGKVRSIHNPTWESTFTSGTD